MADAPSSRLRRTAQVALLLATVVVLALAWPTQLGGRTAYVGISGQSMEPTYHTGDMAIATRVDQAEVGDVLVYRVPDGEPGAGLHVIHRVTKVLPDGRIELQGDNNPSTDPWTPRIDEVVGRVQFLVPRGSQALAMIYSFFGLGVVAIALVMWAVWPRDEDGPTDAERRAEARRRALDAIVLDVGIDIDTDIDGRHVPAAEGAGVLTGAVVGGTVVVA